MFKFKLFSPRSLNSPIVSYRIVVVVNSVPIRHIQCHTPRYHTVLGVVSRLPPCLRWVNDARMSLADHGCQCFQSACSLNPLSTPSPLHHTAGRANQPALCSQMVADRQFISRDYCTRLKWLVDCLASAAHLVNTGKLVNRSRDVRRTGVAYMWCIIVTLTEWPCRTDVAICLHQRLRRVDATSALGVY